MSDHADPSHDALLDHRIIAERYFFPRRAPITKPFVVESGGCELHCRWHKAGKDTPLLVHFHGNGEVVDDWQGEWGPVLAGADISTLFAEYRGYGGSSGTPALAAMLEDAVAMVSATGVPANRIVAYGRSVGSIYALHAAAELGLAGLIIESGIAEVGERLLLRLEPGEIGATGDELRAAISARLDHQAKLEAFAGPVLVLHARNDHLVGIEHGEKLADWAGDRGRFVIFERGDHNTIHAENGDDIIVEVIDLVEDATAEALEDAES